MLRQALRTLLPAHITGKLKRWLSPLEFARWQRTKVGPGSYIDGSTQIIGMRSVRVGRNSQIGQDCWLNVNYPADGLDRIIVGDHCLLGRRNTLAAGKFISIGDFCLTGGDCSFLGANHGIDDPMQPYVTTAVTADASIVVEPNCWFGAKATVVGSVTVGRGSIVGASAVVVGDIPPFSIAVGNPARVVRRYSFAREAWVPAKDFSDLDGASQPDLDSYSRAIRRSFGHIVPPRTAAGRRGGHIF